MAIRYLFRCSRSWLTNTVTMMYSREEYSALRIRQPADQSAWTTMPPCTNSSSSCCASATCGAAKLSSSIDSASSSSSDTLKNAAKASLASFLSTRLSTNGDIAQDVYRAIRDEAHLLLERQMISDALDSDPFELMRVSSDGSEGDDEGDEVDESDLLDKKKNREMIERFKNILSVISCERTTTLEGYSSIRAIVELKNDGMMRGVNDNVRLHFTFVREPQQNETTNNEESKGDAVLRADAVDNDNSSDAGIEESNYTDNVGKRKRNDQNSEKCNKRTCTQQQKDETDDDEMSNDTDNNNERFTPKTIVTYKIDMSVDYGQMETLLGVDIYALGEHPSVEEAIPMMHDEDGEDDEMSDGDEEEDVGDCNSAEEKREPLAQGNDDFEEIEMIDSDDSGQEDAGKGDRFGVFVDPQCIVGFLDRLNMNLNEQSVIYLLLTIPLYEHEWDISGFVLSSMFDDDEDEDDEDDGSKE